MAHFDVHFYTATTEYRHEIVVDLQDADVSGYYPTAYSVVYNPNRREFDISLDGLTLRLAS